MEFKSESDCCKAALQVQDACNIGGVLVDYRNMILYLRSVHGFEYKYSDHPAVILWHDKIEDMLRVPITERTERYSWAYDECKRIAFVDQKPRAASEV